MDHACGSSSRTAPPVEAERRTFTARALVIGIVLTAALAWLVPVSLYDLFSSRLHYPILPPGVVAVFCLLLTANFAVNRVWPRQGLHAGELVVIFTMMWLGLVAIFEIDVTGNTLAIMAAPNYFASTENRWDEYYLAYMRPWAIPSNRASEIRYFYNGLPPGAPIPWHVWYLPFFWWGSLFVAIIAVVICLMTMVHEQWHGRK